MARPKQIQNLFKPAANSKITTPLGSAGFDNARENIDPHIKTQVVSSREGSVEKVPVLGNDITNKTYVDGQFPVTHASTTGQTTDDHHAQSHSHVSHTGIGTDDHHAETHTIVSHDTTGTGANVTTLTDNSMADALHRHSELSASDGTPDRALVVDALGNVGIGTTSPGDYFSNADNLVVYDASHGGITIVGGTSSSGSIMFADGTTGNTEYMGQIRYHHATDSMTIATSGTNQIGIASNGNVTFGTTNPINVTFNGNVGIGTTSPASPLHIDQSSTTAAIPVLTIDQADVSEEMIEFKTTIGAGNAIEAVGAKALTTTHFIKVTLPGGLTRYIPCGTIA